MGKALAFFALSLWLEVEVGLNRPLLEVASFERPPTLLPSAKRASCEDENMKKVMLDFYFHKGHGAKGPFTYEILLVLLNFRFGTLH